MLKINDLHVHYGGIHAVKGVSLSIPRGSVVTLIGANGAGKSSIIRSIAGLVKGAKGEVLLTRHEGDQPVQLLGQPAENMVRSGIALSPEGRRILPHLTVAENLQLGAWCREDKEGIAKDIEVGEVYTGKVVRIMNFGAFVELLPGKDGMIHISKLAKGRVEKCEDVVKIGDEIGRAHV